MSPLVLALVVMQSAVYSWTDKSGLEHFTDDLPSIPRGVKVRTTDGEVISRIDSDVTRNPRPTVAPPAAQPAIPTPSEQAWRQLFRTARIRVSELEEEIEADRKKVEEVNGLPVQTGFVCNTGFYNQPIFTMGAVVVNGQPLPGLGVSATMTGATVINHPVPLYAAPCFFSFNPEFERVRERLDKNRREVVRAREELADLERRASFEAVPLHWRR